ncbi:MAG: peptidoglycan-binding protein [Burkholderiaceae bacterium]|jgi:peptidoglycan hydrolase-like protein with peptidoglycan-binding domain|nr:peptidoglycan-binding protein [Burkholderiaceae bacterium]
MSSTHFSSRARLASVLGVVLGFGAWAGYANGAQGHIELASAHATLRANDVAPGSRVTPEATEPELRFRMRSPLVRELQVRLRHAKYLAVDNVDDRFGALTREGVQKLQRDSGLPITGVVDSTTWNVLLERSRSPTEAELNNRDIGPWFTAPAQQGFVRELQHRLRQVGLYQGAVDGNFDDATRQAIEAWRARAGLAPSDVMDERAWVPLVGRTRNPRYADLFNAPPASALTQELDPRCAEGKVICISRQQRVMSYVVNGEVKFTREARFARPGWESPEGEFRVWYKNSDTISKIFGERTPMPYAIFYEGNVAVHFSQDFADKGYESGSHGCSQLRDYQVAKWLYEQVKVGDRVVVY